VDLGLGLDLTDYAAAMGLALVLGKVEKARQGSELDIEGGGFQSRVSRSQHLRPLGPPTSAPDRTLFRCATSLPALAPHLQMPEEMKPKTIRLTVAMLILSCVAACDFQIPHECGPPHDGPCDVRDDKTSCVCTNHDPKDGPREECGDLGEQGAETCTPSTIEVVSNVGCCAEAAYPALRTECLCRGDQPPSSCTLIGPGWVPISSCAINGALSKL
jgi:hypothetical protein